MIVVCVIIFSFTIRYFFMRWIDRTRQVKIFLIVAAVFIAVASLLVSRTLTHDLSVQERSKMEVWAEAVKSLSAADENTDLNLVLKVLDENHTIPVVVLYLSLIHKSEPTRL